MALQTIDHTGADEHEGLYEAPVIQMVINRVFYKNASDDGIKLRHAYEPFPFKGLALVLTAVSASQYMLSLHLADHHVFRSNAPSTNGAPA